jgi:hypothetical protein
LPLESALATGRGRKKPEPREDAKVNRTKLRHCIYYQEIHTLQAITHNDNVFYLLDPV